MPRSPASLLALALGAAAMAAVGGCGGQDAKLLPGETAREITANLETVKQLSDEGDCVGAESAAEQVTTQIEELGGVDSKLKEALRDGAERLEEVIAECEETGSEAIAPAEVPEEAEPEEKPSKAEKKAEKERAKQEKEAEAVPPAKPEEAEGSPQLPPQAKGEGKGLEEGDAGPPETGGEEGAPSEAPSGGVGPGSAVGEGE
ncbi:MAG TPA: hypothetical protein VHQ43_00380 [Solirubrobacterales bacterium]|jgi:hypothetical protein|nr:hypothetical protein [Solirubrobacterales bacterium]